MHKKLISMVFFVLVLTLSVLLTLPQYAVQAQCTDAAGAPVPCPQAEGGDDGGREKKATRVPPPTPTLVPTETPTPVPTDTPIPTPTFTPVACPPSDGNAGIPSTGSDPSNLVGVSDEQQPEGSPWLFGGGGLLLGIVIGGLVTPGLFSRFAASTKGMVDPGDKNASDPEWINPPDPDIVGHSSGGSSRMGPSPHMAPQSDFQLGETQPPEPDFGEVNPPEGDLISKGGHSGGGGGGGASLPEPHMQAPPEGDMVGHSGGGGGGASLPEPHMQAPPDPDLGEVSPPEGDFGEQAPPEGDLISKGGHSGGGSNRMGPQPHMQPGADFQTGDTQPPDPDLPVDGLEGKG